MENFTNVKLLAKKAFTELMADNKELFVEILHEKDNIKNKNQLLSEMFWNDFCVEWNILQADEFIRTNLLLDTKNVIPLFPSLWIEKWGSYINETLPDNEFNENFDFRKYPFEKYLDNQNKLDIIFSTIFDNTPKDFEKSQSIQKNLLSWNLYDNNVEINKSNFSNTLYQMSQLKTFNKLKVKDRNMDRSVILLFSIYYGKQNKQNTNLFKTYSDAKVKIEELNKIKENCLSFRDEDSKYWRYFLSAMPSENFKNSFLDTFEVKTYGKEKNVGIVSLAYSKNMVSLLEEELPIKQELNFTHKKIKI